MNKNSNKNRHLKLFKYSENLKQEGKFTGNESRKDFLELSHYSAMLASQLNWETRDQYLKLLNEFMEEKIDIPDFCSAFRKRYELNDEVSDILESNLILLSPHENALDFAKLVDDI